MPDQDFAAADIPANSRVVDLSSGPFSIGRASAKDGERSPKVSNLFIRNSHLSKSHARVWIEKGAVYLEDVGSTFGTVLNNQLLVPEKPASIIQGDTVGFVINRPSHVLKTLFGKSQLGLVVLLDKMLNPRVQLQFVVHSVDLLKQTLVLLPTNDTTTDAVALVSLEILNDVENTPDLNEKSDNNSKGSAPPQGQTIQKSQFADSDKTVDVVECVDVDEDGADEQHPVVIADDVDKKKKKQSKEVANSKVCTYNSEEDEDFDGHEEDMKDMALDDEQYEYQQDNKDEVQADRQFLQKEGYEAGDFKHTCDCEIAQFDEEGDECYDEECCEEGEEYYEEGEEYYDNEEEEEDVQEEGRELLKEEIERLTKDAQKYHASHRGEPTVPPYPGCSIPWAHMTSFDENDDDDDYKYATHLDKSEDESEANATHDYLIVKKIVTIGDCPAPGDKYFFPDEDYNSDEDATFDINQDIVSVEFETESDSEPDDESELETPSSTSEVDCIVNSIYYSDDDTISDYDNSSSEPVSSNKTGQKKSFNAEVKGLSTPTFRPTAKSNTASIQRLLETRKRSYDEADLEDEHEEQEEAVLKKKKPSVIRTVLKEVGKGALYVTGTLLAMAAYGGHLENQL